MRTSYIFCKIFFLSVISNFVCANDSSGLYVGQVANQDVVLLIRKTANKKLSSKYFYRNRAKDISLNISKTKSGFRAKEYFNNELTGSWVVRKKSNPYSSDVFNGQWVSPKSGKQYNIILYKVDTSGVIDTDMVELYDGYKIDLKLNQGNRVSKSGLEYVWRYSDTRKGQAKIKSPYLLKHPDKINLAAVNHILEAHHRSAVMQAMLCDQTSRETNSKSKYGEFNLEIKVALLTRKIMSVKAYASWICSGTAIAHNSSRSFVIDLVKGRIFKFKSYFNRKSGYGLDSDKKDQIKILARQYYKRMPKKEKNYDCLPLYTQLNGYSLALDQKGLVFNLDLPRVAQACVEDVLIPYSALRPYVNKRFRNISQY